MKRVFVLIVVLILVPVGVLLAQSGNHPWRIIDAGGGISATTDKALLSSVGQIFVGSGETDSGTVHLEAGGIPGARVLTGTTASFVSLTGQSWNMLSVPLLVVDYRTAVLYPSAISSAFAFSGNAYVIRDTLENGTGYWLKFAGIDTVTFSGTGLTKDSVNVQEGWNMIGSVYFPLHVSDVTPIPPVTISGDFYSFSSDAGYSPVDTLNPGKAYWVKVSHSGRIVFNSGSLLDDPVDNQLLSAARKQKAISRKTADAVLSTIAIKDARDSRRQVRFSAKPGEMESSESELPPIPPSGILDVRFSSQRSVEALKKDSDNEVFPILISSAVYPITITWKAISTDYDAALFFTRPDKPAERHPVKGEGNLTITENGFLEMALVLKARKSPGLPASYILYQNYPNPFNPVTTFQFSIASRQLTVLKVYDLLGREVATLVNEIQDPGYKSVQWDASGVASGVYLYRLQSGTFVETRKLVLLK